MLDFAETYEIVNDKLFDSLVEARKAADNDPDRLWFVREGDDHDADPDDCDEAWDVELFHGQYVNCVGYFVTTEPCRPEHRDTIFTY